MTFTIANETPWNEDDLRKLIAPHIECLGVTLVRVQNLVPQPGVKREDQDLFKAEPVTHNGWWSGDGNFSEIVISLMTPKRAEKATEALTRLAVVDDIRPDETFLPEQIAIRLRHALDKIRSFKGKTTERYGVRDHLRGRCKCQQGFAFILVRGDPKIQTNTVPIEEMERKLMYADREVSKLTSKLDAAVARRARLVARVEKARAKAMNKAS